jgi:hypothetical protein
MGIRSADFVEAIFGLAEDTRRAASVEQPGGRLKEEQDETIAF